MITTHTAKPEHEVAYQDLCALVNKHADKMTAIELLAVASNMLGKLIALQDQRVTTRKIAMDTVIHNLELGNKQAQTKVSNTKGNA